MALTLELIETVGPESRQRRFAGVVGLENAVIRNRQGALVDSFINPDYPGEAPLDQIGIDGLLISASETPIDPEDPTASRIIRGTRTVETNSQQVADELVEAGICSPPE